MTREDIDAVIASLRSGDYESEEYLFEGELEIIAGDEALESLGYDEPGIYAVLVGEEDSDMYDDMTVTAHFVTVGHHIFMEYFDLGDENLHPKWTDDDDISHCVDDELCKELTKAVGIITAEEENFDRWFAAQFHNIDDVLKALPETDYYDYEDTLCFYIPPTEEEIEEEEIAWDEFLPEDARKVTRMEAAQMILDRKFEVKTPD